MLSGLVNIFYMTISGGDQELEPPVLLGEVNTTARLTCLAVWRPVQPISDGPSKAATSEGGVQLSSHFMDYLLLTLKHDGMD